MRLPKPRMYQTVARHDSRCPLSIHCGRSEKHAELGGSTNALTILLLPFPVPKREQWRKLIIDIPTVGKMIGAWKAITNSPGQVAQIVWLSVVVVTFGKVITLVIQVFVDKFPVTGSNKPSARSDFTLPQMLQIVVEFYLVKFPSESV